MSGECVGGELFLGVVCFGGVSGGIIGRPTDAMTDPRAHPTDRQFHQLYKHTWQTAVRKDWGFTSHARHVTCMCVGGEGGG